MCGIFFRVPQLSSVKQQALNPGLSLISNVALIFWEWSPSMNNALKVELSLIFLCTCALEHNDTYSF